MPEPKAQLIDPQGPIDVPGMQVTGVTTATGGFVGQVQGTATGFAATTYNLNVGIVTATKFQGNTTGNVSGLADDTNINVGIITSTSFTGDLVGNAAGLSTTTANINAGIMSATSFAGNFTGVASGITGTPNIVVGIMTGTLNGDGSALTGIAATNWIANNVTANSSTTTVNLSLGNVVKFTQSADTTVSFANTGTSNIVSFIRIKDSNATTRTLTWPSSIKWDGGSAPDLVQINPTGEEFDLITLLTRDEGVTWYGWLTASNTRLDTELYRSGYGGSGENAQNNRTDYSSPVQVAGSGWQSETFDNQKSSMGANVKTDGTLWVWGNNNKGQLGQNQGPAQLGNASSPVQIPGTTWAKASVNYMTFHATKTDGTLWVWGDNDMGMLGLNQSQGTLTAASSPTQIPGTTWDYSSVYKLGGGSTIKAAIKTDGTLWMWGDNNEYGMLGQNSSTTPRSSPVQVPGTTWDKVMNNAFLYSGATKTDGTLWTWGRNLYGQLGHGNNTDYSSPKQVGSGTDWATISGAYQSTFAVKTDGTLYSWGYNNCGMLGQNSAPNLNKNSPVQVPGTTWSNVTGTFKSIYGNKTDGTAWVWGRNNDGQLGLNSNTAPHNHGISSPTQVPGTWKFIHSADFFKEV